MASLGQSIIVVFAAIIVFGLIGFMCLARPEVVQQWIVSGSSKTGIFLFRRYVSSSAYIIQLRFVGLGAAIASLGLLFVFFEILTKLWK